MHAVSIDRVEFAARLRDDIQNNRVNLPTLPEVALRVRDEVERDSANAHRIADMVGQDAALSARLLQVANSPLYRGRLEIDSLRMAVARLGNKLVRSLVVSLVMKQIFQATSVALDRQLRRIWEGSLQVAAISRVLANNLAHVDSEQAMLGGLVHNIGALPILTRIDDELGFDANDWVIDKLIDELAPEIGHCILQAWNFPAALAAIPRGCQELDRDPAPAADYTDVVLVARLQQLAGTAHPHAAVDWRTVPAFAKVGLEPEVLMVDVAGPAGEIAEVRAMLDG